MQNYVMLKIIEYVAKTKEMEQLFYIMDKEDERLDPVKRQLDLPLEALINFKDITTGYSNLKETVEYEVVRRALINVLNSDMPLRFTCARRKILRASDEGCRTHSGELKYIKLYFDQKPPSFGWIDSIKKIGIETLDKERII